MMRVGWAKSRIPVKELAAKGFAGDFAHAGNRATWARRIARELARGCVTLPAMHRAHPTDPT